jgi:hypothetical protein
LEYIDNKFKHTTLGFNEVYRKEEEKFVGSEEEAEVRHEPCSVMIYPNGKI